MAILKQLDRLRHDDRGLAGIEMAIGLVVLTMIALNGVELAQWFYARMEVASAAQMATQNAWKACDTKHLPATTNCSGLNTAIANSLAATKLGGSIQLATGSPTENYYCVNSSGQLTAVGSLSSKPADCSSVGDSTHSPGDYITVAVTMNYAPIFSGITVGRYLPATITSSNMMRLQ